MLNSKMIRRFAGLVSVSLLLAACSSGGTDSEASGEINVFLIPSPSSTSIQSFIPDFEAETGIKVNVSETPYGEAHQKQLLSYQQKAGAYDVAQFDNSFLMPYCQAQAMAPLDSYLGDSSEYDIADFSQSQQDYGKCNGETLGLTLSTEPMIQWYRTDIYEKLGLTPAKTWDEYYNNEWIFGRPIATVGDSIPEIEGDYWMTGVDAFTHLLLPTAALMLISVAGYVRYSRASLLEVLNQDYIRTARAKGLNERTVIMRHAFRNSLIPLTTIMAFDFAGVLGGAIITESVFGWIGMGTLVRQALFSFDLNLMMGVFLITSTLAVSANLVSDLLYSALDPRIRVGTGE